MLGFERIYEHSKLLQYCANKKLAVQKLIVLGKWNTLVNSKFSS